LGNCYLKGGNLLKEVTTKILQKMNYIYISKGDPKKTHIFILNNIIKAQLHHHHTITKQPPPHTTLSPQHTNTT
jgi:hypothetical protein